MLSAVERKECGKEMADLEDLEELVAQEVLARQREQPSTVRTNCSSLGRREDIDSETRNCALKPTAME